MTEEIDYKEQYEQAQVVLAYVLATVGKVEISREALEQGLPEGAVISVTSDIERNVLEISLEVSE